GSIANECGTDCTGALNGGRLYVFCDRTDRDYGQAATVCGSIRTGMDLVSITSAGEQAFVSGAAFAISMNEWWIGLRKSGGGGGTWSWEDGSAAPQDSAAATPYNNWASGEPNGSGDCARFQTTGS